MKGSRFTELKIINILKEAEAGVPVTDLCRTYGFSKSSFYKWKAKYGGLEASDLRRLRDLEEEHRRLKQMYAELSLEHRVLKDVVEKKL
jgi:putative transposase